jgi:hypothetical protein
MRWRRIGKQALIRGNRVLVGTWQSICQYGAKFVNVRPTALYFIKGFDERAFPAVRPMSTEFATGAARGLRKPDNHHV